MDSEAPVGAGVVAVGAGGLAFGFGGAPEGSDALLPVAAAGFGAPVGAAGVEDCPELVAGFTGFGAAGLEAELVEACVPAGLEVVPAVPAPVFDGAAGAVPSFVKSGGLEPGAPSPNT